MTQETIANDQDISEEPAVSVEEWIAI